MNKETCIFSPLYRRNWVWSRALPWFLLSSPELLLRTLGSSKYAYAVLCWTLLLLTTLSEYCQSPIKTFALSYQCILPGLMMQLRQSNLNLNLKLWGKGWKNPPSWITTITPRNSGLRAVKLIDFSCILLGYIYMVIYVLDTISYYYPKSNHTQDLNIAEAISSFKLH